MICKKCGSSFQDSFSFCPVCNTPVNVPVSDSNINPNATQQPTGDYTQQTGTYQQPSGYQQQPYGYQQQPNGYQQQQPNGYQQQPYGYQQQPYGYQQQPNSYQQQPNSYQQQPNSYQQQPNSYQQQPYGYQQQPNGYQQQPYGYQQQPYGQGGYTTPNIPNDDAGKRNKTIGIIATIVAALLILGLCISMSKPSSIKGYYTTTTQAGSTSSDIAMIITDDEMIYVDSQGRFFIGSLEKEGSRWYAYRTSADINYSSYEYFVLYKSGGALCVDTDDTSNWVTDRFHEVSKSDCEQFLRNNIGFPQDTIDDIMNR